MLYQNYYGTIRQKLTNPKGVRINGVYGMLKKLLGIINDARYDGIAVLWDHPSPTIRHMQFPLYKANRSTTPDDLRPQFEIARQAVEACQVKQLELPSFEADDIIATFSHRLSKYNVEVEIMTGDKDLFQLVNSHVVWRGLKDDLVYDVDAVVKRYGVSPKRIPDLFALVGDAADNLPGVPSIGVVRGKSLLQEFESVENIVNLCKNNSRSSLEKMKNGKLLSVVQNYLENKHPDTISLELAVQLNTLVTDIKEVELEAEDILHHCKYPTLPQSRKELKGTPLNDFLEEHGFKSLQ